jgi:hypothetical protein
MSANKSATSWLASDGRSRVVRAEIHNAQTPAESTDEQQDVFPLPPPVQPSLFAAHDVILAAILDDWHGSLRVNDWVLF